jgi:hypothetical protein
MTARPGLALADGRSAPLIHQANLAVLYRVVREPQFKCRTLTGEELMPVPSKTRTIPTVSMSTGVGCKEWLNQQPASEAQA